MKQYIFLSIITILAFFLLFYKADKKFIGHHDWNGVVYSNIARNYNRYGFIATKFGQVRNYDLVDVDHFSYFTHYPPLLPILIALSFRFFGESELSARVVPIISSLILIFFVYLIGKKIANKEIGFISVVLITILPIFVYFGKMPVHEIVSPAFSVAGIYFFLNWSFFQRRKDFFFMFIFLILGICVSWAGYYALIALILYTFFCFKSSLKIKTITYFVILGILMFSFHLLHTKILTGSFFGGGLFNVFLFRSNPYLSAEIYGFSFKNFLLQEIRYFSIYYTKIVVFLSLIWWLTIFWRIRQRKIYFADRLLLILFIYGVTHLILFSNMAFIHDYMIYYLMPFIVLSATIILSRVLKKIPFLFLRVCFFVFIFILIGLERITFVKTLLDTSTNERGYKLGEFIKQNTKSGEKTFVGSNSFKEFQEVFIGYYSDRNVDYGEKDIKDWAKYSLIIRPKEHDALELSAKDKLEGKFKRYENADYIWYFTSDLKNNYGKN